jgi:hypothetical protein
MFVLFASGKKGTKVAPLPQILGWFPCAEAHYIATSSVCVGLFTSLASVSRYLSEKLRWSSLNKKFRVFFAQTEDFKRIPSPLLTCTKQSAPLRPASNRPSKAAAQWALLCIRFQKRETDRLPEDLEGESLLHVLIWIISLDWWRFQWADSTQGDPAHRHRLHWVARKVTP